MGRGTFYSGPSDKESFSLGGLWCEFDPQPRADTARGRSYEQACKKRKETSSHDAHLLQKPLPFDLIVAAYVQK